MNVKFSCCLFSIIFLSAYVFADEFLDECLKISKSRDLKLAVAEEQIGLAQTRLNSSVRSYFPQITLQSKFSKGSTALQTAGSGNYAKEEYNSEEFGIKAVQPIYEGGGTKANHRYNSLMLESAKYNYTKTKEELFSKVKLAYYEYLTLKMEYTALSKAFVKVEKLFFKTRLEYKAKAISELDLAEAKNFRDKVQNLLNTSKINLEFATKKLIETVGVISLEDIPAVVSDELPSDIPEISFTLQDCLGFVQINNLEVKIAKAQIEMAEAKIKISRAKVHPKLYIDGFYGKSGEAYVTHPLELTTSWNIAAKLSWGLWGNSLNASASTDRTDPTEIVDSSRRVETTEFNVQLGILDDFQYFVEAKESDVGKKQTTAELVELLKNSRLSVEKAYNEYTTSLNEAKVLRDEIRLKERKLALMTKRNDLYEVQTVSLMEESWKYAETISAFAKQLYTNHSSITELEKLTLMNLR